MINFSNKMNLWAIVLFVFLTDQLSKEWSLHFLTFDVEVQINKILSLHQTFNSQYLRFNFNEYESMWLTEEWQFKVVYSLVSFMLIFLIIWATNQPAFKKNEPVPNCNKIGLFLILGGIFGNAADRLFRERGVIDFIRIKLESGYDFIFNIADVAILIGEGFLLMSWILLLSIILIGKVKLFIQKKPL